MREIDDDGGRRLVRIVRRDSGPVVTWRRAQMVLLSAQGMDVAGIAKVAFTSEDRIRDVIRNFNADGFSSLYPKYKGGRPPKSTLGQRPVDADYFCLNPAGLLMELIQRTRRVEAVLLAGPQVTAAFNAHHRSLGAFGSTLAAATRRRSHHTPKPAGQHTHA